ncbi:hypothetical protein QNN03_36575 [Streptomyces sp. GXMU-J15]|uniref:Uncharacterized protein n=1 Tax=Streptomyces fuscus TaxID=3048495 RepID=A0ABT7JAP4_9ACTN|nr:hypothetical protein [Streptomyces fuscus]MDL2081955.1 hypothetical protein [Streptomyces fuscus]
MHRETPSEFAGGLLDARRWCSRASQDFAQPGLPLRAIRQERPPGVQDLAVEQRVERLRVLTADAVLVDHEVGEERLVEEPAQERAGRQVRGMAVACKIECACEVGLNGVERSRHCAKPLLDGSELLRDALLFAGDEIHRYSTAVDRFEELLALRDELRLLGHQVPVLVLGFLAAGSELVPEPFLDGVAEFGGQADGAPVILDHLLDLGDEQRLTGAAGDLLVSSQAHEVGVDHAVAVLGVGHDQAAAAVATEHGGLEVVRVLALPFADQIRGKDILDLLPRDGVGERRVVPRIDHPLVDHLALVVGVGQDAVQDVRPDWARGHLGRSPRGESPGLQFVSQGPQRPLAAGEGGERPSNQLGAIWVHLDRAFFASVGRTTYDVQVAEWGLARRTARLGLLAHPLVHLGGEVAGVELRDGRHDAVQQHPGGGLVDVLGRGDQGRASLLDRHRDLDVVDTVPGQAVDFVDEHVVDRVLGQIAQHFLEFRPVRRLRRLPRVDELRNNHGANAFRLSAIRFALSGDGEAFCLSTLLGLFLGRDSQVGDAYLHGAGCDHRVPPSSSIACMRWTESLVAPLPLITLFTDVPPFFVTARPLPTHDPAL